MIKHTTFDSPLFALGFRMFFALSGLSAIGLIAIWRSVYDGSGVVETYYPDVYWHAHEMLFGYTVAVITGFLLTAVKNWTGRPTVTGGKLASLGLLWIYGRIVPFYADWLPGELIALIDFAFLPAVAYFVSKPIVQAKQFRNLVFIGFLLIMIFSNGLIHSELLGFIEETRWLGIQTTLATIIVMILVIAGRVFPFFTEKGISGVLCIRSPMLDLLSIGSALFMFLLIINGINGFVLAIVAIISAVFNGLRVRNWYTLQVWYIPLLWILYIGYGWIILGFILTALSAFALILPSLALHAFTMGGIGVMTLGMMSRVSLGHTGRALKASQAITLGFVLINLAVFIRIFVPAAFSDWYLISIYISTGFWLAAFSLFAFVYLPILSHPRIDGKPG